MFAKRALLARGLVRSAIFAMLFTGCAGASVSWLRSNKTHQLKKTPYYRGETPTYSQKIGHLPVTLDKRMHLAGVAYKKEHFAQLTGAMNQFLDELKVTTKMQAIALPIAEAPDIYVGNISGYDAPTRDNVNKETRYMVMHTFDPSSKWRGNLAGTSTAVEVELVLFITLGLSEYMPRQTGFLRSPVLDLGTGYARSLSWLSDLESPGEVLHLTGALLDRDGHIWRAGAEGIIARPTGFGASMLGVEGALSDKDIAKVLNEERREDLPEKPLAWQVALQNLVGQLLQRKDLIVTAEGKGKVTGT